MIWLGAYFLGSDIGRDIRPTCGTLCIFFGPFGQMAKNGTKNSFLIVLDHFPPGRISLIIWLWAYVKA
jgi:hypothetical protein